MHPRAKKSLGQNFLIQPAIAEQLAEAAHIAGGDTVVEIGPGTGALTRALVARKARIVAIEKDARLIAPLRAEFPDVEIIEEDALQWQPTFSPHSYAVVGNIPYYITSHILRVVLETWATPRAIVFMVQKEVAERIVAGAGDMNLLALSVQAFGTAHIVRTVSQGNFHPEPNVDSAIIAIFPHAEPLASTVRQRLFTIAKRAFSRKRQLLAKAVAESCEMSTEEAARALRDVGILDNARPQDLSAEQWVGLAQKMA